MEHGGTITRNYRSRSVRSSTSRCNTCRQTGTSRMEITGIRGLPCAIEVRGHCRPPTRTEPRRRKSAGTGIGGLHFAIEVSRVFIHSVNEARQAPSARALWHCPEAALKLELAIPQAPLPADSPHRTQGGHTAQVEVSVKEGRLGHLTFMSDSQG